jgi:uracil phosphoribosyltransferase
MTGWSFRRVVAQTEMFFQSAHQWFDFSLKPSGKLVSFYWYFPGILLERDLSVTVVDPPLVKHHLTQLRSIDTPAADFRRLVGTLSTLLACEATKNLLLEEQSVQTPLCDTLGWRLKQRIGLVPILRAGLGMLESVQNLIPDAEVRHLGFYRDEETALPVEYYNKLSTSDACDAALILDPMLATGGSASLAFETLTQWGVHDIRLLSLVSSPEGIAKLQTKHPTMDIFVCTIDDKLNDRHYIVPGLGDAGDRIFGT